MVSNFFSFFFLGADGWGCCYMIASAIQAFQLTDHHALRVTMDRNSLWLFLIGVISTFTIALQNYYFAASAAQLTFKLRSLSFKAILRQDSECLSSLPARTMDVLTQIRSRVL